MQRSNRTVSSIAAAISLSLGVLASGCNPSQAAPHTPQTSTIAGKWESLACEVRPQRGKDGGVTPWYLKRKLRLTDNVVEAEFVTYADAGCTTPVAKLEFGGHYQIVGDSEVVGGAKKADLTIDSYTRITPLAEGFAGFLGSAGPGKCGREPWSVGKTQDVKATGCTVMGLQPGVDVREFEVLYVRDDLLFFAARPVDGSSPDSADKRPKALQMPVRRVQ